jgi:hypothetical protein
MFTSSKKYDVKGIYSNFPSRIEYKIKEPEMEDTEMTDLTKLKPLIPSTPGYFDDDEEL